MKTLGKISSVKFGSGGYQDAMFGATFYLDGHDGSAMDFWGFWATEISSGTKWTEEDRTKYFGEMTQKVWKLMKDAKVSDFKDLKDIPIEITFDGPNGRLSSWRVLKEVL